MEDKLHDLAYYNELTNLYNKYTFQDYINANINDISNSAKSRKLAIIYLNVDNLRSINDMWGYSMGDKFLQYISETMLSHKDKDFIYTHLAADNFAIIVNNVKDEKEITNKLNKLLDKFIKPWEIENQHIFVTFSIGIVIYPEDGEDLSMLMVNADTAMWYVKQHGKDGVCFYDKEIQKGRVDYMQTANQIKLAIQNEEFVLYYQPQVDFKDGKIIGLEALIRWDHPEKGLLSPSEFIPLAEKTGQIYLLWNYVLEEVCKQISKWEKLGCKDILISINISGVTLIRSGIHHHIKQKLEKYKIDGSSIKMEVTETAIMKNLDIVIRTLDEIKKLGITVSLDDFGTGYSSLTYLDKLPIDAVKIDKAFIKNIKDKDDKEIIVEIIIYIAKTLGLELIAEGVEFKEQLDYLIDLGCMKGQGYLFSKPLPAKKLEGILAPDFRYSIINDMKRSSKVAKKVYAVKVGRETGIFNTWNECKKQVIGFSGAEYKSFKDPKKAEAYMEGKAAPENIKSYDRDDSNKSKETMIAYVDGSYDINTNQYGSGVVILWDGAKQTFKYKGSDPVFVKMRNVAGEIIGAQRAMEYAVEQKVKKVIIYYDYEGIEKWCTGDWKAKKEGTKDYKDACQELNKKIEIQFVKVAAHTGDKYNEEADSLAKKAINL